MILEKRLEVCQLIAIIINRPDNPISDQPVLLDKITLMHEVSTKWKSNHKRVYHVILQLSKSQYNIPTCRPDQIIRVIEEAYRLRE